MGSGSRAGGEHRRKRPADQLPVGGVGLAKPAGFEQKPDHLAVDLDPDQSAYNIPGGRIFLEVKVSERRLSCT